MFSYTYSTLLLAFLLSCSAASAFNITKILEQNPDFSSFNSYLTQTQLAAQINSRQTITVLAVSNGAISAISGQSPDVMKKVLSLHVVLDYYDMDKINNLQKKTALLTTLFQSSGLATGQMGFLNVTVTPSGVKLSSAVPGAGLTTQVVKSVAAQPYNISVLQVSGVIVPPAIQNTNQTTNQTATPPAATAPAATPQAAPTPAATPKAAPAPKKAPAPAASSPSASTPSPAASAPTAHSPSAASPPAPSAPSKAPAADAPAASADAPAPSGDASSPSSEAPASGAPAPGAGAPAGAASDDQGESPGPSPSSGARVVLGSGLASVMGVAVFASF